MAIDTVCPTGALLKLFVTENPLVFVASPVEGLKALQPALYVVLSLATPAGRRSVELMISIVLIRFSVIERFSGFALVTVTFCVPAKVSRGHSDV